MSILTLLNARLRRAAAVTALALFPLAAAAQNSIVWTTNYYSVTGANLREIRQSITAARPWKDSFDGDTRWTVKWNFKLSETANGCACACASTATKIVTTLPRWKPAPETAPEAKEQWAQYLTSLTQHEAGHARFALAAAAEVGKSISATGPQRDCDALQRSIDQRANRVVDDYRVREQEYDRRTEHGTKPPNAP